MSRIRVDAEPLCLTDEDRNENYVPAGTLFLRPRMYGMEVDAIQRIPDRLAQPAKLRRNPHDEQNGSYYHLRLTRHRVFTVMVPVILAEF